MSKSFPPTPWPTPVPPELNVSPGASAGGGVLVNPNASSGVQSVSAGDASIVVGGTPSAPTIETATLDEIATLHPPAAAVPMNGEKITGLANGTNPSDAAAFGQIPAATVVSAGDASIVVGGTASAPTIETATLDEIAALHPPAAAVAMNGKKITGLANGAAGTDAAAFGQIPTTLQPTDPGTNKVWGSNGAGASLGVLPPGYEISYTQITAPVNVASTTESGGTAILSPAAATFDGGAVLVEFFAPGIQTDNAGNGDLLTVSLFEGATQIGRLFHINQSLSTDPFTKIMAIGKLRFTPSAGSHTYSVTAFASSTTGTPQILAGAGGTGAFVPAYVRFTKV